MSQNVHLITRDNPLILEIKIESDSVQDGFPAVTPVSLMEVRNIINRTLLLRHYKLLIIDVDGIEYGGSALMAKFLMCYEKTLGVKCRMVTINMLPRLYAQSKLAGLDLLMPSYSKAESPKPEQYNEFFQLTDYVQSMNEQKEPENSAIPEEEPQQILDSSEILPPEGDPLPQVAEDEVDAAPDNPEQHYLYSTNSF